MKKLDYLIRAEKYAEARGDENFFKHWYTRYREYYGVQEAVERTLETLYGYNFVL